MLLWAVFSLFTLYFFRDPEPITPSDPAAILSPACGKVDVIDEVDRTQYPGGRCRRVSIFMSIFDVHVQRSPVAGRLVFHRHTPGRFLSAMRADSAAGNEHVILGVESSERPGEKIGIRLTAGLIARRIVVWAQPGDELGRGDRLGTIQFGSRVDVYMPPTVQVTVKLGDRVRAGATRIAIRSTSHV